VRAILKRALALTTFVLCTVGARPDSPVPWPRGEAPTTGELDDIVTDAVELFELERFEEYLEALESGEDSEHIFVMQEWIDERRFDTERLFLFGDSAFEHDFRLRDGIGAESVLVPRRVHLARRGGIDNYSCGGCHFQGGVNGAGPASAIAFYFGDGEHISSAVVRSPPNVLGLGFVQALGAEMSRQLGKQRDNALRKAKTDAKATTIALEAKGVSFGKLVAYPDGRLDTAAVQGIDPDLVVRPFGWKGHTARLRRFAERAARTHFGIQSHVLAIENRDMGNVHTLGPALVWHDPDGDGRSRELEEGTLTAIAIYMALLEAPIIIPPHDPELRQRWARGGELFTRIGCNDCHRRSLKLHNQRWVERPDTTDGEPYEIHLARDGEKPRGDHTDVQLFSDLRRHAMGEQLADAVSGPDGIARDEFITRPLWGLAESAPYLHDGRAVTIPEAILAHGGEAATQRSSFEALSSEQQADLHVYLLSLTREPKLRVAK